MVNDSHPNNRILSLERSMSWIPDPNILPKNITHPTSFKYLPLLLLHKSSNLSSWNIDVLFLKIFYIN